MKIWFVQGAPKTFFGGGEQFAVRLASWLRMQGHDIEFVARPGSVLADAARAVWLSVHELALRNDVDWFSRMKLKKWFRKDPPDVLFGAYPRDLKLAGRPARRVGARVIWLRGIPLEMKSRPHVRLDRDVVHHYVVPSEFLKDHLVTKGGYAESRVEVVYPGMDTEPFEADRFAADLSDQFLRALQVPPSAQLAVCLSRLYPEKGHSTLLKAWAHVCERTADAFLVLAGEGPLLAELTREALELGIAGRVRFVGHLSDVRPALWNAHMMITPSNLEPLGIVLLESMAAGVPNIATCVGGIPEVIQDEVNGLLVPAADALALSTQMLRLLGDPELHSRLVSGGRERVKQFTADICFPRILSLIESPAPARVQSEPAS